MAYEIHLLATVDTLQIQVDTYTGQAEGHQVQVHKPAAAQGEVDIRRELLRSLTPDAFGTYLQQVEVMEALGSSFQALEQQPQVRTEGVESEVLELEADLEGTEAFEASILVEQ